MNKHTSFKPILIAGIGAALMGAGASALADPPSRVARLAYVSGAVSFAPAGDNVWEAAALNRPLIPGDRLWVEPGARDEVQVTGAALRMGGGTLVTLLNNDDRVTQLQLSQGRLNVHVRRLRPNDVFEIDTPNLALSIRQPGDYRIEVDPAGNATMVAVRRGQAEAYGDGNAYRLASGQAYSFGGTDLRDSRYARPLLDDFDRWSDARERRIEQARSVRYVSPDLVGYEDLDDQGTWRVVPNYGNVWMPAHVGRDWAPYRDGHWSYVQPWGWTWVDDAPWGYAVSHYGRWARFNDGWGWVPGPRASSPVYAPALVAFVNLGTGSYAPRERPVAWFPLAPREVYRPSYRASPNYITNINLTNTAVDRRHIARDDRHAEYANRRVGGAVTAVPAAAFVQAQPVSRAAMAVPVAALAAAAIAHNAPVAPERESMRGHRGQGNQPPQAVMQRQALARNAPPQAVSQAPMPQQQAAQAAAAMPAPRVLPQDRRGNRQFGQLPAQGAAPMMQPQAPGPREARRDEMRQAPEHGQRNLPRAAVPQPAQVAPMTAPAQQVQAREADARRDQMRQAREHGQREGAQAQAARTGEQQIREQQVRAQQDQQARMQQQAREQEQRGRAQQQEQQASARHAHEQEQQARAQQAREQEQRGRAQQAAREQEQQARVQHQAREQEQRGRAQQQEQQARAQQQAREQEQQARAQQQARDQEQRGRAQQEQQARMQQQARDQEQRGRAQQQAREQEQQARMQQQAHAQEQAHAQQQARAQEQAQARAQAQAAQSAAQAQAAQARAQAQAQAAQAQANQAKAQAQQASAAASAPPEHGHGHGRDRKNEKEQQN